MKFVKSRNALAYSDVSVKEKTFLKLTPDVRRGGHVVRRQLVDRHVFGSDDVPTEADVDDVAATINDVTAAINDVTATVNVYDVTKVFLQVSML
jgi:hypothetical protein